MYKNTTNFKCSLILTNEDKVINLHCKTTDLKINPLRKKNKDNIMFITNIERKE